MFNAIISNPAMRSPLHTFDLASQQVPADGSKGVWANEMPLLGYLSLRGNPQLPAFLNAAHSALGAELPTQPCTLHAAAWGSILWLAPDEWLLICARTQLPALHQALSAALAGIHSQVVDNSGGFTSVVLQGRNARDVLQHCSVYNVDALEPGRVVGTTFGKATTLLHRNAAGYGLVFRRSFADYIWQYLRYTAQPYGFGIALLDARPAASTAHSSQLATA